MTRWLDKTVETVTRHVVTVPPAHPKWEVRKVQRQGGLGHVRFLYLLLWSAGGVWDWGQYTVISRSPLLIQLPLPIAMYHCLRNGKFFCHLFAVSFLNVSKKGYTFWSNCTWPIARQKYHTRVSARDRKKLQGVNQFYQKKVDEKKQFQGKFTCAENQHNHLRVQSGAVKLILCRHWMHLSWMQIVASENQFHCPRL